MKLNVLNRKVHYWATLLVAVPALIVISTGLLLQMKKHWSWVQPVEYRGTGKEPVIDFVGILNAVKNVEHLGVTGWEHINRLDVRPGRGMVKVWLHTGWEAQVDLATGNVLHTAYRRSDLIESIHDGSFFAGEITRLGLFLPAGLALLVMWGSGIWMFWVPFAAKRRKRAVAPPRQQAGTPGRIDTR